MRQSRGPLRGATAQLLWATLPLSLIRGLPWATGNSQVLSVIKCADHSLSGLTYLVLLLVLGHAKWGSHSLATLIAHCIWGAVWHCAWLLHDPALSCPFPLQLPRTWAHLTTWCSPDSRGIHTQQKRKSYLYGKRGTFPRCACSSVPCSWKGRDQCVGIPYISIPALFWVSLLTLSRLTGGVWCVECLCTYGA